MKRKLLLAVLCVVGALGMRAQTDVTSSLLNNPSFELSAPNTPLTSVQKASNNALTIYGWNQNLNGISDYNNTEIVDNSTKGSNSNHSNAIAAAEGSYHLFFRRSWNKSSTADILFTSNTAEYSPGSYTITYSYILEEGTSQGNTTTGSCMVLKAMEGSNAVATSTKVTAKNWGTTTTYTNTWATATMTFSLEEAKTLALQLVLTPRGGNKTEIHIDNFVLTYTDFKAELRTVIAQAQAINARISTLSDDITTAQGVLNTANASKTDIDGAVTTLRSAISTKLAAYTGLNVEGDDITSFIVNNGFETSPTFDGTSLGSNTDPKSNATPTAGSTLLFNAYNVYQVNGWELMTTETSDFARTFTMPYNTTLYVRGNNSVAGQAVTSPANGSSVTTENSNLLFVEANWCENDVLGVKQTVPLPSGSYRLTFDTYVTTTVSNAESRCGVSYGETTNYKWPTATNTWTPNEIDFTLDSPTDVTISMGYKKIGNVGGGSSAFLFVDNVKLTYFDPLKLAQIQWQETHNALAALDKTALPDAAESAITTALGNAEPTTVEGYDAAKADLQALIDSYDEIKAAYDKVNTLINFVTNEKDNSTGDKTDIEEAISTATTDIETRTAATDLEGDYNTLETARQTYVTSGAEPTAGHPFDWTFKLSNPSFEEGTTGWTLDKNTTGQWNYGRSQNDPVDGAYNLDAWAPQINYINVYQTVTLPLGSYSLKGYLYSSDLKSQHIYAYTTSDNPSSNLSTASSWEQLTADFTQSSKSGADVKLGIYSQGENISDNSKGWFRADHFQLFYNGIKPLLNDLIVSTTDLSAINVGTGAFQIPSSAVETLTTAIGEAQAVYNDDDATGSDVQTAIDNLNTAIETYQIAGLNAPVSGVQYRIKSTAANSANWKNKYYVLKKNPNQPNGGYSTQAEVETTDAFYATAWEFVSVSGNQYKLRMTDADGAVRYLCTNIKGYDEGSATQIRTTTDADKALVVKVIAATGTDGRWFLQNTEDNSYLGGQDAGLFSNSQNYDLAIEAASQAEVAVSVAAGKYATRIFPFKPTLPEGVVAYSCAAVDNENLTLAEVESPAANVPYILYSENGVETTNLTGWGTASAVSYEAGLLTGVYTNAVVTAGKYVLQTQDGVQGFYQVAEGDNFEAIPYRAYLTWSGTHANVRALFFPAADEATGIEAIGVLTSGNYDAIYTAGGAKVNSLQKGLNIVVKDGKSYKIFVK